jgi:methylglutamate dehydrogenase subunit D
VADLARRSPLEGALTPGDHGATGADGPGVFITERRDLAILQLMARKGQGRGLAAALAMSDEPGRASVSTDFTALPLAPGHWLLAGSGDLAATVGARLGDLGHIIEQDHARAVLRLSGPRARDVLAKGCRLDLHARAFAPGSCAQTPIAKVSVLIHQVDEAPTFDLYVPSGYGVSFIEWLAASAAEFGYRFTSADAPRP